jgi:hypothetical protein
VERGGRREARRGEGFVRADAGALAEDRHSHDGELAAGFFVGGEEKRAPPVFDGEERGGVDAVAGDREQRRERG